MSNDVSNDASNDAPLLRRENGRTLVRGPDGAYAPLLDWQQQPEAPTATHGAWWIAKRTTPEEGESVTWEELTPDQRLDWFGTTDEEPGYRVCLYLAPWIERTFPGVRMMRSPALTGCLCIEHTLPWAQDQPQPYRYYQLPDSLARLVAATTTPLRMQPGVNCEQVLTLPARRSLLSYHVYDARMAYAKWLRSLPIITEAGVTHDHANVYEPYQPGRYLACVTVPKGWAHIGLARRALEGGGYDYPDRPGQTWCTWLEEPELRLLHDNPLAPWHVSIQERILYAPKGTRGSDPLRVFCERVFAEVAKLEAAPSNPARSALRHALRAMLINPVGLWHRGSVASRRPITDLSELREGEELDQLPGGQLAAVTYKPLAGPVARWRRPEWSAAVFGYVHVAAVKRALSVPRSALLGMRGDALHLADCDPGWSDDGKVGTYRLKEAHTFSEAYPAPHTPLEFARLERVARHG